MWRLSQQGFTFKPLTDYQIAWVTFDFSEPLVKATAKSREKSTILIFTVSNWIAEITFIETRKFKKRKPGNQTLCDCFN